MCLLHEKPFAGVNGSGKHNNWSIATDTRRKSARARATRPHENAQFLLFLCAVIQAVDDYQDLLRLSVATAGNDHRLGANEAPPADRFHVPGRRADRRSGRHWKRTRTTAPAESEGARSWACMCCRSFSEDTTDRNRTSPFAFTGNKFEFRMLGSSNSIAVRQYYAQRGCGRIPAPVRRSSGGGGEFRRGAPRPAEAKPSSAHKRIIFNGNGYDEAWIQEAVEKRGLLNLRTTPDALPYILEKKNVDTADPAQGIHPHGRKSAPGMRSTWKTIARPLHIEALTMVDMARKEILPAVVAYTRELAEALAAKRAALPGIAADYEQESIRRLSGLTDEIAAATARLENALIAYQAGGDMTKAACFIRDEMLQKMAELRVACDEAETLTAEKYWPFPTYDKLLFSVK